MTQHVNEEGVPLRGDGTPFPSDPSQWSEEEKEYLEQYFFNGELEMGIEEEQVAVVDVPEMTEDGQEGQYA
jgi:hypothetical protein